jgi:hypothetical protein
VSFSLSVDPARLAIARLEPGTGVPAEVSGATFCSVTRTPDEVSVVAPEDVVPAAWRREGGWRALRVAGPLDFELVGVLAALLEPLAAAGVPVFALSTFDTDYLLVREERLADAVTALRAAGHAVDG